MKTDGDHRVRFCVYIASISFLLYSGVAICQEEQPALEEEDSQGEAQKSVPISDGKVPVKYLSHQEGVFLHLAREGEPLTIKCCDDCEIRLEPGFYDLALSQGAGDPVELAPISVRDPVQLHAAYTSKSHLRAAGWVVLILGLTSGVATTASGVGMSVGYGGSGRDAGIGMIAGGAAAVVISLISGLVLVLIDDDAKIYEERVM